MVEFDIKIHPKQRLAYIPKEIIQTLGFQLKIIPNLKAAVVYPANENPERILKSLEVILADLKLRLEDQKQNQTRK